MASVNKVILVGNCGRDPEIRYLPSGQAVANVSVATSSRRKDKTSGEMVEETQWHRVTFFERLATVSDPDLGQTLTITWDVDANGSADATRQSFAERNIVLA